MRLASSVSVAVIDSPPLRTPASVLSVAKRYQVRRWISPHRCEKVPLKTRKVRLKLGDRVRIKTAPLNRFRTSRGRIRDFTFTRRKLSRRIGQSRSIIGSVKIRGSRKLFYVDRHNLGRVVEVLPICLYRSLIGVALTIVEITKPWIICERESGTIAPGLTKEDLELWRDGDDT